jgi:LPS export ABC transporter protein LptC
VKLTYYAEDGRVVTLTADSGSYEDATRNVTLQGNVVVNTSDGNHVDTDAIAWNQKSGILKGKGEVRITRGDSIIRGKGFELSPENETVNIYNVTGIIHKKEMNL